MNQQTIHFFIFLGLFLALTGITHLLHTVGKLPSEASRKFLHVSGGILALFLPLFFDSHWWVLVACLLAFLLLLVTYLKRWLPAVHQTRRKSFGSVLFPVPVYLCFYVAFVNEDLLLFYLPVSLLTVSDTIAELSGKRWGQISVVLMRGQKSLVGSLSFAICSLVLAITWCFSFDVTFSQLMVTVISVTVVATLAELISTRGFDNLTVPLSALALLYFLKMYYAGTALTSYTGLNK